MLESGQKSARKASDAIDTLANVLESIPAGIAVSSLATGQLVIANDCFLHLVGYDRVDVLGRSIRDAGIWDDKPRRDVLSDVITTSDRRTTIETTIRTRTGDGTHVEVSIEPIEIDGVAHVILHIHDMTHLQQAEKARRVAETELRALIEQLPAITYTEAPGDTNTNSSMSAQLEAQMGWPAVDEEGALNAGQLSAVESPARRAAETALRTSEARFRALAQHSQDVITVADRDGTRTYASPSIKLVLGYEPEALVGGAISSFVHPDDEPTLQSALSACLSGAPQTPVMELSFRHRNGEWRDFETVGINLLHEPAVNGIVFNSRDITARKQVQAALRDSEERFHAAFARAPIGLALITAGNRFRQVNRALCDMVGYTERDLVGAQFEAFTFADDVADNRELSQRLWAGQIDSFQAEKRYVHNDGHLVWVEVNLSVVDDGVVRYGIAQIQDVTRRRQLDLERATMLASERAYTNKLHELSAMRSDLSAMVAHELRAPVAALRMMASALATGELPLEAETAILSGIQGQIDQLDRITSDVATMTAAEKMDFATQLHEVPLAVILNGAATFVHGTMADHPFSMTSPPDVHVWCDPARMNQVFMNLLGNVVRHTGSGTAVEIHVDVSDKYAHIEVRDDGPGVPPEDQALIFEKFARGRTAAGLQSSGLGLGLYVSRQIVQAHGSELSVRSGPKGGAVFAFDLRLVQ